jgi:iron(III) transport system substrate-binding protein
MRRLLILLSLALLATACAAPAPSGTRDTASPGASAAPAPAPAPAALPAGVPADWERQWQDLIAAARQEGKVVLYGPPTREAREWLPKAFQDRFGVEMEYAGTESSGVFSAKLATEYAVGKYSADAAISGANSAYDVLAAGGRVQNGAMGMLAPLRPALIHPDVLDPSRYLQEKLWFMDPEQQYILRLSDYQSPIITVNTDYVRPSDITSLQDLLKPEYRGKIASFDPTQVGSSMAWASHLYLTLGKDFVRQLYVDQQPFISRDHRQLADQMARGTRPITLNLRNEELVRMVEQGLPIAVVPHPPYPAETLQGGGGFLVMFDKAPHPNAAKLVANWLAGPEGAFLYGKARQEVPTRMDIDRSAFTPYSVPKQGVEYFDSHTWEFVTTVQPQIEKELRELIPR